MERETGPNLSRSEVVSRRALAVLVVAGCVLRLARPEVHSFWIDEGLTLRIAQAQDMVAALRDDSHPPLSFLVWRAWGHVFGWSDLALRILPAIVSCASLVLFVPLARAWLGRERANWAVALYAVAPLLVWIAHEVRMYAFVEIATLLTLHAARAAWTRPALWRWIVLGLAVSAATGLHYYGAMVAAVVVAQACVRAARGAVSKRVLVATAAAAAFGIAAWTPWLVTILPVQYANEWPRIARFTLRDLAEAPVRLVAVDFAGVVEHGVAWIGWTVGGLCALGFIAGVGMCAWRVFRARDRAEIDHVSTESVTGQASGSGDLLCAALVPIAAALALAVCMRGGFQPRYLITAVPGTIAIIACGLAALRPGCIARAGGVLLCTCALAMSVLQLSENRREDYRSVCSEIAERFRPGDRLLVLVCVPAPCRLVTIDHYLRDRPDILASVLDTDRYLSGDEHVQPGTFIHVIWREASLCFEPFDRLRRTHVFVEDAPARFRIHRLVTIAP